MAEDVEYEERKMLQGSLRAIEDVEHVGTLLNPIGGDKRTLDGITNNIGPETNLSAGKNRVNYATYPQDYYTGSQVRVLFGGIWVDDIATIQYQTSQSKTPLYGYADQQFRSVAKGQLIVNGVFTLAFKETGYLRSIIDLIKNDNAGISDLLKDDDKFGTFMAYINNGLTPEAALDKASTAGTFHGRLGASKKRSDFEDIAEVLEDSIWGKDTTPAKYQKKIPRSDELDYNKYTKSSTSFPEDIDRDGFDILITFGNYQRGFEDAEHTMKALNDVHIIGESMIISPSDEPVGIQYTFFARGIDENVTSSWATADKIAAESNEPIDDIQANINDVINNDGEGDNVQLTNDIDVNYLMTRPDDEMPVIVQLL